MKQTIPTVSRPSLGLQRKLGWALNLGGLAGLAMQLRYMA